MTTLLTGGSGNLGQMLASSLLERYGEKNKEIAIKNDLDISLKPSIIGSVEAQEVIGYQPICSTSNLLDELRSARKTV